MNISQENIDAQNAVVTIKIAKADYEQKVEDVLKNYRKKAVVPGFRPGHAPVAMIKKMYSNGILVDEVNKLIGESLNGYIKDNNLEILGEPLPSEDMKPLDFDSDEVEHEFKFDIAIAPEVKLDVNGKITVPYYSIKITDQMIEDHIETITSRFGKNEVVDSVAEKSLVKGAVSQDGGVSADSAVLSLVNIKDDAEKAKFVGKKAGDVVAFDINKALTSADEISYLLKLSKEEAAAVSGQFSFTIEEVSEFKSAELNQDIFDQVYGKDVVKNLDEFKAKVKETIESNNAMEQDYRFAVDAREVIMKKVDIALPEAFLKRWLIAINQSNEKFTPELLEEEMPKFLEDLKWRVIKNSIIKKNDIKLEYNDTLEFAKKAARAQFMQYGLTNIPEEHLNNYAVNMLKNEEQLRNLTEGAANDVVITFVKGKVKLNEKEVTREEFNKFFE